MNTRNQTADLLKGIAVLFMIQVHIMELFASSDIYNSSLGHFSLFLGGVSVAPIFMILFGYFIAQSHKTTIQLVLRGLKIFGLGMLLNLTLNLNLIISVLSGRLQIDMMPYLFGVDILQLAGISLIIIAFLKNVFNKSVFLIFIGIFFTALLGNLLLNYIPEQNSLKYFSAFFYGSTTWSYFPLFPWFAYPLMGYAIYQLKLENYVHAISNNKIKIGLVVLLILFLVFAFNYAVSISSNLPLYYHHGLVFFSWTIIFSSLYVYFVNTLNAFLGNTILFKYLKWLGIHVTMIYVIQWIIIGNTATEIYKTVSNPYYLVASFILIVLASCGLSYLILLLKNRFIKS